MKTKSKTVKVRIISFFLGITVVMLLFFNSNININYAGLNITFNNEIHATTLLDVPPAGTCCELAIAQCWVGTFRLQHHYYKESGPCN